MENLGKNKKIEQVCIDDIILDSNNPRFLEKDNNASQEEIVHRLNDAFDLLSMAESIVKNGYSQSEPIVTYSNNDAKKYIVAEGNRRASALKILTDDKLRNNIKKNKKEWDKLSSQFKTKFVSNDQIPVVNYETRDEVLAIVSQSHIKGKLPWGASEQARFITDLIDKECKSFEEVHQMTGIKISEIKDKFASIKFCEEISQMGIPTEKIYNRLTILQICMTNKEVRSRLQIKQTTKIDKDSSVLIENFNENNLKEVIVWIFGSKNKNEILSDSRNIVKFAQAISSEIGVGLLRSGESLESTIKAINENGSSPQKITNNILTSISTQIATLKFNYSLIEENERQEVLKKVNEIVTELKDF